MSDSLELVLVRHAESIWNAEDRWQGQTDVPLSARGEGEAARVGKRLVDARFDAIVCSDLSRARTTAEAIVAARGGRETLHAHSGLREMDLGAWCGLPHAEVITRFPDELRALQSGDDLAIGGHGESLPRFEDRVHGALAEVLAEHRGATRLLVVTHGGYIRSVLMRLLGLRGRKRPLEGAGNTSITTLRVEGDAIRTLLTYNDAGHLDATRAHDGAGADAKVEHTSLVGPSARARVRELLELTTDAGLGELDDGHDSIVDERARRLVRYGVRAS